MEKIIKEKLSEKRYRHSVAVAELARELAQKLGENGEKAYLAGLVHDIAKEMSADELISYCNTKNIMLSDVEKNNPALIHAPAGAEMVKEYGISDVDVQNAIKYHTVGRAGMTLLEKIIYLADMIEPSRSYKEADELRQLVKTDFDMAFKNALRYSIVWNIEKQKPVHEGTLHAWNSILSERKNDI